MFLLCSSFVFFSYFSCFLRVWDCFYVRLSCAGVVGVYLIREIERVRTVVELRVYRRRGLVKLTLVNERGLS